MRRRAIAMVLLACGLFVVPGSAHRADAQSTLTFRVATLAPRGTPIITALIKWDKLLRHETDGRLRLQIYPGGVAGDERVVVRKMRAGQLDAAIVTITGLGLIARQSLVLSVPGVIMTYKQLDRVYKETAKDFDKIFEDDGYVLMGWGDAGRIRLFSQKKINSPSDLKSARPWVWGDNPVMVEFMKSLGANGVNLGVPEVYPGLQTGMVDTVTASALTTIALQWFTRLKYVSADTSGIICGAMVIRKDKFDKLSEDNQELMRVTARIGNKEMRRMARGMDDKAYQALLDHGLKKMSMTGHLAEWQAAAFRTREALVGRLFPKSLLEKVEHIAAEAESD